MDWPKRKSLQDVRQELEKQSVADVFVGREKEVARFAEALRQPFHERHSSIFSIYGQGGVGKSFLLRRFRQLAQEKKAFTAWTDDTERNGVEVMARLAGEFGRQGKALKAFNEGYKKYRQKRAELESDAEAPKGTAEYLGRTLIKAGLDMGKHVPGAAPLLGLVDKDEVATRTVEIAAYVARKLRNKTDSVQLVREPLQVLTPLWLEGLWKLDLKRGIVLFFDTYEATREGLEPWLPELMEGSFGAVPANLLVVIGGHLALSHTTWAEHERFIARMPLESFTESETKTYLHLKGTVEPEAVTKVFQETKGLPVMVAFMGDGASGQNGLSADPSTAVERFLRNAEPQHRQAVLDAALARRINRDVVAELTGPETADAFFGWLMKQPYIESHKDTWTYHSVVRHHVLEFKRRESPRRWMELHGKLARHYELLRDGMGLAEARSYGDSSWRLYALETLYHRLCENPRQGVRIALNGFLAALREGRAIAREWAETIEQAERDAAVNEERAWGRRLLAVLKDMDENRTAGILSAFSNLLREEALEPRGRAEALDRQGCAYMRMNQLPEALKSLTEAVELVRDAEYLTDRARVFLLMGEHKKCLLDLDLALALEKEHLAAISARALVHLCSGKFEEALQDIDTLQLLVPGKLSLLNLRLIALVGLKSFAQATTVFLEMAARAPDYLQEVREMFKEIQEQGLLSDFENFLSALVRVLDPRAVPMLPGPLDEARRVLGQGGLLSVIADLDKSLSQDKAKTELSLTIINVAIDVIPSEPRLWLERAQVHETMSRFDEARSDYDKSIEFAPAFAEAFARRARFHQARGNHLAALRDCERALSLQPGDAVLVKLRSELNDALGPAGVKVIELETALEREPHNLILRFGLSLALLAAGDRDGSVTTYAPLAEKAALFARQLRDYFASTSELERWLGSLGVGAKDPSGIQFRSTRDAIEAIVKSDATLAIQAIQSQAAYGEGLVHNGASRMSEAVACFTKAIELEPVNLAARFERAKVYEQMGLHEDARSDLKEVVGLKPKTNLSLLRQSLAYLYLDLYEQALRTLSQLLDREPDFKHALLLRLSAYASLERFADALVDLERLSVVGGELISNLPLYRAEVLCLAGRLNDAEESFKTLLVKDPENVRILYDLAALELRRHNVKAANEIVQGLRARIGSVSPDVLKNAPALVLLGGLELMTGNEDRAFELLEQALAVDLQVLRAVPMDLAWSMLRKTARLQAVLTRTPPRPIK